MRLSTKGKYGLYAMVYLAQHEGAGPQALRSVASIGISENYLEQLLGNLRKGGLVNTVRGAQGGYLLARPPEEITVCDIIDATEGPLNLSDCIADEQSCHHIQECKPRKVWEYLTKTINGMMQQITLRDILEKDHLDCVTEEQSKEITA